MKRLTAILTALIMCFVLTGMCEDMQVKESMMYYEPLCGLAENYGFLLGGCLSYNQLTDKAYTSVLARHFNSTTCTNEMKAYSLLDQRASQKSEDGMPRMNYRSADSMVSWAQQNGLGVRGHVLVWDAYMTDWFFRVDYDSKKPYADQETMRMRLRSYIEQVITHFEENFPGVVYCWDVVNEAVGDSMSEYDVRDNRHIRTMRSGAPNIFYERVGSDYVEYSFMCAKDTVEANGYATNLYYNDYNAFMLEKRMAIIALVKSINSYCADENGEYRKLCDGVGMQGYIGGYGVQTGCMNRKDISSIKNSIISYAALGVEVQITEMAVRNFDKNLIDDHAEFYAELFKMFIDLNKDGTKLTAVTIWGMQDNPYASKDNYSYKMNGIYGGLITERSKPKKATHLVYLTLKGEY